MLKTQLHGKDYIEGDVNFTAFVKPSDKKKKGSYQTPKQTGPNNQPTQPQQQNLNNQNNTQNANNQEYNDLFDSKPSDKNQPGPKKKPVFKNRPEESEVKDPREQRESTSTAKPDAFNPNYKNTPLQEDLSSTKPDQSMFMKHDNSKIPPKFDKINPRAKRVNEKNFVNPVTEQQQEQPELKSQSNNEAHKPNSVQKALHNFGSAFGPDQKKTD